MQQVSFEHFYMWFCENWKQGEHLAVAGPTGCGKTTLIGQLLEIRDYVLILAVKAHDDIIDQFHKHLGYQIVYTASDVVVSLPLADREGVILNLPAGSLGKDLAQTHALRKVLNTCYQAGGWTIFADDLGRITGKLKLHEEITSLLSEGRSSSISMVVAMTQPKSASARVPSESFRQCIHKCLFGYDDITSQKTIADLAGLSPREINALIPSLGRHNFLYVGKGEKVLVQNAVTT